MMSVPYFVPNAFTTFLVATPPPPPPWPPPPPPRGSTAGSTSTLHTCLSYPCFYVGHIDAMDTWATSKPALLDREGLFSPWYIRLLHILGIRPHRLLLLQLVQLRLGRRLGRLGLCVHVCCGRAAGSSEFVFRIKHYSPCGILHLLLPGHQVDLCEQLEHRSDATSPHHGRYTMIAGASADCGTSVGQKPDEL